MNFPKALLQRDRKMLTKNRIKFCHFMYARIRPASFPKEINAFPSFTDIKMDQSVNWSAFSVPLWVRFDNNKIYKKDYGIVAFSVKTITHSNLYTNLVKNNSMNIIHCPIAVNYSHCEFKENMNTRLNPSERLAFRVTLSNNGFVYLRPNEELLKLKKIEIIKMYFHRFAAYLWFFKGQNII